MAFDDKWTRQMYVKPGREDFAKPSEVTTAILGHGYTDGTLPSDGFGHHELACLELENEDLVVGWLYVWFNK